jgi:uncharacterized membrane protein
MHGLFRLLIGAHILTGTVGLVLFWVAVTTTKGGDVHKRWGLVFVYSMLVTGTLAIGLSSLTLLGPFVTHPQFVTHPHFRDEALVRGLFGWMMQYLAILTISLAWHGWGAVRNKRNHAADRHWINQVLQYGVIAAALNTAWHGWLLRQPTMLGLSIIGVASGLTNLWFAFTAAPKRFGYLIEHAKALVGAAISAYTAFLAFGLVRLMPEQVFNPFLWAIPLVTGLSIIIYHTLRLMRRRARGATAAFERGTGSRASAVS